MAIKTEERPVPVSSDDRVLPVKKAAGRMAMSDAAARGALERIAALEEPALQRAPKTLTTVNTVAGTASRAPALARVSVDGNRPLSPTSRTSGIPAAGRSTRLDLRSDREGGTAPQPECPLALTLRKARVGQHEGRAGPEAANLGQGALPLLVRDEAEGQRAGRPIERPLGRVLDGAGVQPRARRERAQSARGERQHLGGRIDAVECRTRVGLGGHLEFQPAAGAENR